MARGIMRCKTCKGGGESRQDVVRNDRFSLSGIAPGGGVGGGRGVHVSKGGVHVSLT